MRKMNIKKIISIIIAIFFVFLFTSDSNVKAYESFVAGEGLEEISEKDKSFRIENKEIQGQEVIIPQSKDKSVLYRIKVNLAIQNKVNKFIEELKQRNIEHETTGWMNWQIGQRKIENGEKGDSIVLIETYYAKNSAHPYSFMQGITFDKNGDEIPFDQNIKLAPSVTPKDIDNWIAYAAKQQGYTLFDEIEVGELPKNYYIGNNGKKYIIFQEYDIAPYSEGWITLPVSY